MVYTPAAMPVTLSTIADIRLYLEEELRNIALEMKQIEVAEFRILYVPPAKLAEGMVVYADGVNWNPGTGAGLYERAAGAWVKLGVPYAEATWVPVLSFGGSSAGITYSTQVGGATESGRFVSFAARVVLTSKGSAIGDAVVSGLPFQSVSNEPQLVNWAPAGGMSFSAQSGTHGAIAISSTQITLHKTGASGNATPAGDADFTNSSDFYLSGGYFVP